MASYSVKRDPKSDVVCAEILHKGVNGIVHIRGVRPLGPIRKALWRKLHRAGVHVEGFPNDPIEISGDADGRDSRVGADTQVRASKPKPGQPTCNQAEFDKALHQVACAGLFDEITKTATHQLKKDSDIRQTKAKVDLVRRAHGLAKFAGTKPFQDCGGWPGVEEAFGRRRKAQHSALIAKGVTEAKATKLINNLLAQDAQVVDAAKKIVEEGATDDLEGD